MRLRLRVTSLASIISFAAIALVMAATGCESDDYVLFFGDGDAGTDAGAVADASGDVVATDAPADAADGGNADADGGGTDASVDGDAGVANDAATDAGTIACGATTCAATTQVCCIALDGTETCAASGGAAPCGAAIERACDDRTDCPSGQICCATLGALYVGSTCAATCAGAARQLCKSTSECANAMQTCSTETCRGKQVSSCGGLPPGQCN